MPKLKTLLALSFAGGLILFIICVGVRSLAYSGKFTPDSVVLVDMAENIASGKGITSSMVSLGSQLELPRPATLYAPVFPLVLAGGIWLGFDAASFALLVAATSLGLLFLVSYLTLKNIFGPEPAMFGVALLPVFGPIVVAGESAWSETIGLTFLMLTFWFLAKTTRSQESGGCLSGRWFFLAGLSAGLAYTTRYALVPLALFGGLWVVAVSWQQSKNLRRVVINGGLFSIGWAILALPVIGRNVYYAKNLRGGRTDGSHTSMAEVVAELYQTVRAMKPQSDLATEMSLISATVLVIAGLWLWINRRRSRKKEGANLFQANWPAVCLLALWPVVYLVVLVYAKTQITIDPLGDRLALPATLVTLLLGGAGLAYVCRSPKLTSLAAVVIIASSLYLVGPQTHHILSNSGDEGGVSFQNDLWKGQKAPEDMVFLRQHLDLVQRDLVIAEDGLYVPFFIRRARTVYFSSEYSLLNQDIAPYMGNDRIFLLLRNRGNNLVREEDWRLIFQNQDRLLFVSHEKDMRLVKD